MLLLLPIFVEGQNVSVNKEEYKSPAPAAALMDLQSANFANSAQVNNFDTRAIQKLKDFYNYLAIITNQSYDKKLRDEAKKQAIRLFYKDGCLINGIPAGSFIDSCANKIKKTTEWNALNVSVSRNFAHAPDDTTASTYNGELLFEESVNGVVNKKKAEMVLSKDEKLFGGTRKEDLLTVYICTISNY